MNFEKSRADRKWTYRIANSFGMICLVFAFRLTGVIQCAGQGTTHIAFEGPPSPSRVLPSVTGYYESGLYFSPVPYSSGGDPGLIPNFRHVPSSFFSPSNGTAIILEGRGDGVEFSATNSLPMDLVMVDLAEGSHPSLVVTIVFIGYKTDGSVVSTSVTTDGINDLHGPMVDFQTYYFDSRFTQLLRVEVLGDNWALDNLFVVIIPEPSSLALLCCGGLLLAACRHRWW